MPGSFRAWRQRTIDAGIAPIVLIGGSRGKTTVARLLEAILHAEGLRTASLTDSGVEIDGIRQHGEIGPWAAVVERLHQGSLDVAIREVDWLTVPTGGFERSTVPLLVITNFCANREACLIQEEARVAAQMMPILINATSLEGAVVVNGEDYAIVDDESIAGHNQIRVGTSREAPLLRDHLDRGGIATWLDAGTITVGRLRDAQPVLGQEKLTFALNGTAGFQVQNAMMAAAAASAMGISNATIAEALSSFQQDPSSMPGSFNVFDVQGITVIVDRPSPSWFLKSVLRAMGDRVAGRLITVAGLLGSIPAPDLPEVGRLLGRASHALVLDGSEENKDRIAALKQGVALNDVPPPLLHTPNDRRALSRAISLARAKDIILALTDEPATMLKMLARLDQSSQRPLMAAD
jgi:cyanophycin synthetase